MCALFQDGEAVDAEVDEDAENPTSNDTDILSAMTGIPLTEDELLYAVPVVAPPILR